MDRDWMDTYHLPGFYGMKLPNELSNPFAEESSEQGDTHSLRSIETEAFLRKLMQRTGVLTERIDVSDPSVLRVFRDSESIGLSRRENRGFPLGTRGIGYMDNSRMMDILLLGQPKSFPELVKAIGLYLGSNTWTEDIRRDLIDQRMKLAETFSCREDVFEFLLAAGIEKKLALRTTIEIRKGRGDQSSVQTVLKYCGLDERRIQSVASILYLYVRPWNAFHGKQACYLAYYKVHYPKVFYKAFFEVYGNEEIMEVIHGGWQKIIEELDYLEFTPNADGIKLLEQKRLLEVALEMVERG